MKQALFAAMSLVTLLKRRFSTDEPVACSALREGCRRLMSRRIHVGGVTEFVVVVVDVVIIAAVVRFVSRCPLPSGDRPLSLLVVAAVSVTDHARA